MRITIANTAPNDVVTLEMAKGAVLNEEVRRRSQGMSTSQHSEVLVTESRGRSQGRGPKSENKGQSKSRSRYQNMECHHCGKKGHIKRFCYKWKRENTGKKRSEKRRGEEESSVSVVTGGDLLLACESKDSVSVAEQAYDWVVDSSASIHVTSRRELLSTYTPSAPGVLKMGNMEASEIIGRGDVSLLMNNGAGLILRDVRHAPDIHMNIISVGQLDDEGYCSVFCDGDFKLIKGSMVVACGVKASGLYALKAKAEVGEVNATRCVASSGLWHKWFGHMSERGMSHLAKKGLIPEMDGERPRTCPHCMAGKQRRVSFQGDASSRRSEVLELIHTDVCGPLQERSFGGVQYFVSFIDDCSRKLWVFPLKTKDQVVGIFKQFHVLVECETRRRLKAVRSDNGGEYIWTFDAYCRAHGIKHQRTSPKTPQLNGVAERMNSILMERVRCLLS
ncbi:hypothetical protein Nepgr_023734 [Nepenthes gracilis]|uniref:Retrovirus-related Pol polyprotein from transposon TNT 1-94 n=1 Tax=Nepenthes gracilis TaxID=150966 RepID=A0AAD3T4R8_NEPGR|nr:hypothetical protein Nepgr_023734 [Nepenthes gracilis]